MSDESGITAEEKELMGSHIEGTVLDVFRWGVFVDLGLSHVGFIDVAYIEDDVYEVGQVVAGHLSSYNKTTRQFWLRPLGKTPMAEYLANLKLNIEHVMPEE